jgi:hypothetical protein
MRIKTYLLAVAIATLAACNNPDKTETQTTDAPADAPATVTDQNTATDLPPGAHKHGDNVVGVMGSGPHKGMAVHGSNGYHVEMVLEGQNAVFYPLDANANPIDVSGWSGKATVQQGGNTKSVDLAQRDGKLIAENLNSGDAFKAVVTLTKGDQNTSVTFDYSPSNDGHTDHDHADGHDHDHADGHDHH